MACKTCNESDDSGECGMLIGGGRQPTAWADGVPRDTRMLARPTGVQMVTMEQSSTAAVTSNCVIAPLNATACQVRDAMISGESKVYTVAATAATFGAGVGLGFSPYTKSLATEDVVLILNVPALPLELAACIEVSEFEVNVDAAGNTFEYNGAAGLVNGRSCWDSNDNGSIIRVSLASGQKFGKSLYTSDYKDAVQSVHGWAPQDGVVQVEFTVPKYLIATVLPTDTITVRFQAVRRFVAFAGCDFPERCSEVAFAQPRSIPL